MSETNEETRLKRLSRLNQRLSNVFLNKALMKVGSLNEARTNLSAKPTTFLFTLLTSILSAIKRRAGTSFLQIKTARLGDIGRQISISLSIIFAEKVILECESWLRKTAGRSEVTNS